MLMSNHTKIAAPKVNTVCVDHRNIVGIDIGKRKHAATAITPKGVVIAALKHFENNREGVDLLERDVLVPATNRAKPIVAMEATGHYWNALYDELQRRGYSCIVLNPIQTNTKGKKRIRKTKTDPLDSELIARTILAGDALATVVPDEFTYELRLLARHRWRLKKIKGMVERYAQTLVDRVFPEYEGVFSKLFLSSQRAMIREVGILPRTICANMNETEKVLRKAGRNRIKRETIDQLFDLAQKSIGSTVGEEAINSQLRQICDFFDFVESQIETVEGEMEQRMAQLNCPLESIGISPVIAATILAESGSFDDFAGPRQYAAFCGLDPSRYNSGDTIHGVSHISKRGSGLLRWALFMAAQTVCKKHHDFKRIYDRHINRGKTHLYALTVVAHKVARVVLRLMKDDRPFCKRPPKRIK